MKPIFATILICCPAAWILAGCGSPPAEPPAPTKVVEAVKTGGAATRRIVKTTTDPDAAKIDLSPQNTTVEDITAHKPDGKPEGRQGPFETTSWRVKATIESIKLMKDHDFYMVLKGDKGGQTVVEVPDPSECKGSPLQPQIAAARKQLEDKYHPTTTVQQLHDEATVTGVGFLGFGGANKKGSKEGRGARLMPGTGFDFAPKK